MEKTKNELLEMDEPTKKFMAINAWSTTPEE